MLIVPKMASDTVFYEISDRLQILKLIYTSSGSLRFVKNVKTEKLKSKTKHGSACSMCSLSVFFFFYVTISWS